MNKWNNSLKVLFWVIISILCLFLFSSFLIPPFIDIAYMIGYKLSIPPNTMFSASDRLLFFGSVLTFVSTIFLGIIAIIQNERLHQQNIELEKKKIIAENALSIFPNTEGFDVEWHIDAVVCIGKSGVNSVVLTDKNIINNTDMHYFLYGDLILLTNGGMVSEYKIADLKMTINEPQLKNSEVYFETNDNYKIVQQYGPNSVRLYLQLYFNKYKWSPEEEIKYGNYKLNIDRLLKGDFKITFQINLLLKKQHVISEYFLVFTLQPIDKDHLEKTFFGQQHKLINTTVFKNKESYYEDRCDKESMQSRS